MAAIFENAADAGAYCKTNGKLIQRLSRECEGVPSVVYSDVWLNNIGPSFVAGFNEEDEMIVCFVLPIADKRIL